MLECFPCRTYICLRVVIWGQNLRSNSFFFFALKVIRTFNTVPLLKYRAYLLCIRRGGRCMHELLNNPSYFSCSSNCIMKRSEFELDWSTSFFFRSVSWVYRRNIPGGMLGGGGGEGTGSVPDSDESPTFISYICLEQRAEGTTDWFLRGRVLGKLKQRLEWDMQLSLHFSLFFQCTTFSHWDNGPMRGKYCQGKYRGNDAKSCKQGCLIVAENEAFCQIEWHGMCNLCCALRNNSVQLFLNTVVRWNFIQCFHICLSPSSSFKNFCLEFCCAFCDFKREKRAKRHGHSWSSDIR